MPMRTWFVIVVGGLFACTAAPGTVPEAGAPPASPPGENVAPEAGSNDAGTAGSESPREPSIGVARQASSGTRLKMRVRVGADGSKEFVGWHDTERDEPCTFAVAADGKQRCIPWQVGAQVGGYFSNAGCTTRLAYAVKGCSQPRYAFESVKVSGPSCYAMRIFPATASYVGTAYFGSAEDCRVQTSASFDFFVIGPEVPASSFVEATERVE